jgi:hypothetical protein
MKSTSQKSLRVVIALLLVLQVVLYGSAVSGNQPISTKIRQRILEFERNKTPENQALLYEEIRKEDAPFRRVRVLAWWGFAVNAAALLLVFGFSKRSAPNKVAPSLL